MNAKFRCHLCHYWLLVIAWNFIFLWKIIISDSGLLNCWDKYNAQLSGYNKPILSIIIIINWTDVCYKVTYCVDNKDSHRSSFNRIKVCSFFTQRALCRKSITGPEVTQMPRMLEVYSCIITSYSFYFILQHYAKTSSHTLGTKNRGRDEENGLLS